MPRVEVVQRHGTAARRLLIRGNNGRLYPYLAVNDYAFESGRSEEQVLQLMQMLNPYLDKQKETARRFLQFAIPRVVSVSESMRFVEDNLSSMSLQDIYQQRCNETGVDSDLPVAKYYDRLAIAQARGDRIDHQVLMRDIFQDIQTTMVPKTLLRDWVVKTFPSATDYWTFRKMVWMMTI